LGKNKERGKAREYLDFKVIERELKENKII